MAIDFPNSPTLNQDFTVNTTTWTYDGAKWVLKTYNSLHAVPVTAMMLWANTTYPTGWLLADGSAISRTTYSDLFTAIGTTYGVGDGSTTFNIPSMPSAGTGSPKTIIKVTNSGALEPSAISHAANHTAGGSDVVSVTLNQVPSYESFRNLIINGGMNVAQRGTSTASNTTGGYLTCDRWQGAISALGTWTNTQESDGPIGINKSWKWLCTTADASPAAADYMLVRQAIEGQNLQQLLKGSASAKSCTVSFWVKSNKIGTYIVYLNDDANGRIICASYTISVSATWEYKTVTFVGDTSGALNNTSSTGIWLSFTLGVGSNYTGSSLQTSWSTGQTGLGTGQVNVAAAVNNFWQVTGVQLEVGSVATPFEFEPFETTLRKCQRYFQKYIDPPLRGVTDASSSRPTRMGMLLPVVMRITPVATFAGTLLFLDGFTTPTYTATAASYSNAEGVEFDFNLSAAFTVSGRAALLVKSGGGTMSLSAEL